MKTFLLTVIPTILFVWLIYSFGQISEDFGYQKANVECAKEKIEFLKSSNKKIEKEAKENAKIYVTSNRTRDDVIKLMRANLY